MNEIDAYRIVELRNGVPHTLFHGMPGESGSRSRKLPLNRWFAAEKKMVRDGTGPWYLSGFNVLLNRDDCEKYVERFTAPRELVVVRVRVRGPLRKKEHSPSNVMLADEMYIPW